jgi:dihydroorotate dehydrogenase
MQLRNIAFRPVANAAGAQGFFGEGYWYHRWTRPIGLTFKGCSFIAKTTTLEARTGNMPLLGDGITPREWMPRCIVVKPRKGVVLNAVGLSGPGTSALLSDGRWQRRTGSPFFLSFMSIQPTSGERLEELRVFVQLLKTQLSSFSALVGLEINVSCPNVQLDLRHLIDEVRQMLNVAEKLNIPLQVKFNALVSAQAVCDIAEHEACDAITMSNTIPWGKLPACINWHGLFGSDVSPLTHLGGGGLSGWPLLSIVCEKIRQLRDCGLRKPIWACGGIDSVNAVNRVHQAGASGIQFGSMAIVRPWRITNVIKHANNLFS